MDSENNQPTPSASPSPDSHSHQHHQHATPLRTFSTDLAEAVKEHGGSVVRIAIAEEEKHRREYQESSIRSRRNIIFTLLGLVLLGVAAYAIYYAWQQRQPEIIETPVSVEPTALIKAEATQVVNAVGMQSPELYAAIYAIQANPDIQLGQVKNIVISKSSSPSTPFSTGEFFSLIDAHASPDFIRSLNRNFMLGLYAYEQSNLFIIIHGTAHDFLLAGMLAWEPYFFEDMARLFSIDTTSFTKAELQALRPSDAVISNRDTRAVLDKNGHPMVYYSFLDPNTIIIGSDSRALSEVVRRF